MNMPIAFNPPKGLDTVTAYEMDRSPYTNGVKRFSWSPDGKSIALPWNDGSLCIWDVIKDKSFFLEGQSKLISCVAWHPSDNLLASSSDNREVQIWDLDKKSKLFAPLIGHTNNITSVAWSTQRKLVSASDDKTVRHWDLTSFASEIVISHKDRVLDIAWSPSGDVLASASWDSYVGLWKPDTGEVQKKKHHKSKVFCVNWSNDGKMLASGDQGGNIVIWDHGGSVITEIRAHEFSVLSLSFSKDNQYLVSRDQKTIKIWHLLRNSFFVEISSFVCYGTPPYATVSFNPKNNSSEIATSIGEFDEEILVLKTNYQEISNRKIFIVHGRELNIVDSVSNYLQSIELKPIVLQEQPDDSLSFIMEKFEEHANSVIFAIVLLTPDDVASSASKLVSDKDKQKFSGEDNKFIAPLERARQNVVLELGYFLGKLGYEKVCIIKSGDLEFPSDLSGVLYIQHDSSDAWKAKLKERLQRSGIETP